MSKKMKGVGFGSSPYLHVDAKARLKHQALFQDYQDLQREVFDMQNKLEAAKAKKKRLFCEVRFLRRRYRYLLEIKSLSQRQQKLPETGIQTKLSSGGRKSHKKEATQFKLPPLPDLKHKGRVYASKENALRNTTSVLGLSCSVREASRFSPSPGSDKKHRKKLYGKDTTVIRKEPAIYISQNDNLQGGMASGSGSGIPIFDLNQDTSLGRKEAELPNRAPTFDLNKISMEEEELNYEEPEFGSKKDCIRGPNDEPPCDLKLSVCRNAGEGSSGMGKRKISWQDSVALRV